MGDRIKVIGQAAGTCPGPERPLVDGPRNAVLEAGLSNLPLYPSGIMMLVLFTRRGCHLCEAAEDMLAAHAGPGTVKIIDVDADPDVQRLYGTRVPVLAKDGSVMMEGRFDEPELARRLGVNG